VGSIEELGRNRRYTTMLGQYPVAIPKSSIAESVEGQKRRRKSERLLSRQRFRTYPSMLMRFLTGSSTAGPSLIVPLLIAVLAGCADAEQQASLSSDEAIEAGPPVEYVLSAEPTAEIGGHEERVEYILASPVDVALLSDGRIAIADAGPNTIRFYRSDGRHLQTIGGRGSGPGEYRRLACYIL
jgi:hypothetical protein